MIEPSFTTLAAPPTVEHETTNNPEGASTVKATEATLSAQVNPNNQETTYSFEYSTSKTLAGATTLPGATFPPNEFGERQVAVPTGALLAPGTTYYYRAIAKNSSSEETKGEIESFTTYTTPEKPETTTPAQSITATTAVLEGVLNPGAKAKEGWHFAYNEGSSCAGGSTTAQQPEVEVQALAVKTEVTNLQPNKEYTFCLLAANDGGESAQSLKEVSFSTLLLPPAISGESATGVKVTEATLQAKINPNNQKTKYFFEYSTSKAAVEAGTGTPVLGAPPAAELENFGAQGVEVSTGAVLTAHTTYFYRVLAENAKGEKAAPGKVEHFTTGPLEAPEKLEAKPIAATTVTLNGVLDPGGPVNPASYEFRYRQSTTECEGENEHATPATAAAGAMQEPARADVSELLANTTYTFCLRESNSAGEVVTSAPITFRTLPEATVTEVAADSATLHAALDPEGAETTYRFQYGTSASYGSETPQESAGAGSGPVSVEAHLQGLAAATVYHFRVIATNAAHETFTSEDELFTTQHAVGEFSLPDNRSYEQVTPAQKEGALFFGGEGEGFGFDIQASAAGDAMIDVANTSTEAQPAGNPWIRESVLSTRRAGGGWSSQALAGARENSNGIDAGEGEESRLFSEDLSHAVTDQFGLFTPLSPQASEATPYLRTNYFNGNVSEHCEGSYLTASSCYQPLVTAANTPPGTKFGGAGSIREAAGICTAYLCGPDLVDATPDLSHIILFSPAGIPLTATPGSRDYEWSDGQLKRLPGELAEQQEEAFRGEGEGANERAVRNEISANGGRVILGGTEQDGSVGPLELFEVATEEAVPLPGTLLAASSDDSRIFLATGNGLEECEVVEVPGTGKHACDLSHLAPEVHEMLGVSEDGAYVYFTAAGVLAPGAVPVNRCGYNAQEGGCNVYVRHDGVTRLVAPGWIGGAVAAEPAYSRVSPDGRWLAFVSPRSPTGYDNRDALSGEPDFEVYLYHAPENPASESGTLTCASCDPTGARPVGDQSAPFLTIRGGIQGSVAAAVPTWTFTPKPGLTLYQTRYLSDSGRLFFDSRDALVPQDVDGTWDVYEYEPAGDGAAGGRPCTPASTSGSDVFKPARAFQAEGVSGEEGSGCVALISAGTSSEGSYFLDASQTGGDVFFATISQLSSASDGGGVNVWDAHECTPASPCPASVAAPPACTTEASCKAPPTPQPTSYGAPSSATFSGPGNITPEVAPPPKKVVTKKTVKCKKGFVKKKIKKKEVCVKKKSRKKAKTSSRANTDRRAKR